MAKRKRARISNQGRRQAMVLVLLLALVIGVVLTSHVFSLRDVVVVGNSRITSSDVARMAQLPFGQNIFRVDIERIADRFASNGKVEFISARRLLPDTIELTVRERSAHAMVNYLGVTLVVDEQGVIMEQRSDLPDLGVAVITGMKLNSFQVGQRLSSSIPSQVDAMTIVLKAVSAQSMQPNISELNVADLDNMYLMTRTGMMVRIGDSGAIDEKLRIMNGLLNQLASEGTLTGELDLSSPKSPVYER